MEDKGRASPSFGDPRGEGIAKEREASPYLQEETLESIQVVQIILFINICLINGM